MDFPILIILMSPLPFLGVSGLFFIFISFFDEIQNSEQNSPRWDAAYCGVTSGPILLAYIKRTLDFKLAYSHTLYALESSSPTLALGGED